MTQPTVSKLAKASWMLFLAAVIGNSLLAGIGMRVLNELLALGCPSPVWCWRSWRCS